MVRIIHRNRESSCVYCGGTVTREQLANRRNGGLAHALRSECVVREPVGDSAEPRATERQVRYAADLCRQNPGVLGLPLDGGLVPTLQRYSRTEISRAIDLLLEAK